MAEKFTGDKKMTPRELAKHLRQPDGEKGKEVAQFMNKGNEKICRASYKLLDVEANNHILEIGMGNGFFIKDLLDYAKNVSYVGADFSKTMIEEAETINAEFIKQGVVSFNHTTIDKLPYEDNTFDKITTTNTVYFWDDVGKSINELYRVLKPGGKLLVAYRDKNCMDQMTLTKYGFNKYSKEEVEVIFKIMSFTTLTTEVIAEPDIIFEDKALKMDGYYTIGIK